MAGDEITPFAEAAHVEATSSHTSNIKFAHDWRIGTGKLPGSPGPINSPTAKAFEMAALEWTSDLMGSEPRWVVDPRTEQVSQIARESLHLSVDEQVEVRFFSQGGFNKLYSVECSLGSFLLRVSLPVDPAFKTLSEVATLLFVGSRTSIPVPRVIAFNSLENNGLGFEWILMNRMPGQPLRDAWKSLTWDMKESFVKAVAKCVAELSKAKFHMVGNIYEADPSTALKRQELKFTVGRIVSMAFFWESRIHQVVPRGPFISSRDWLHSQLLLTGTDIGRKLEISTDEDEIEDLSSFKDLVDRLFKALPDFFPHEDKKEVFSLMHDDISWQNLLSNNEGQLTALVDWECVSVLPMFRACQIPSFLEGRDLSDKPLKMNYFHDVDGNVNQLYFEHMLDYEKTVLRKLFLHEMGALDSEWVSEHENPISIRKADFEYAITHCDDPFRVKRINRWLDSLDSPPYQSLRKLMWE